MERNRWSKELGAGRNWLSRLNIGDEEGKKSFGEGNELSGYVGQKGDYSGDDHIVFLKCTRGHGQNRGPDIGLSGAL